MIAAASTPPRSGIKLSVMIRSGRLSAHCSTSVCPLSATETTSCPCVRSISTKSSCADRSVSATATRNALVTRGSDELVGVMLIAA